MSKVVVVHPGRQHSVRLAAALNEAGLLERYITRFAVPGDIRALDVFSAIVPGIRTNIMRRRVDGIPRAKLTTIDTWAEIIQKLLPANLNLRNRFMILTQDRFAIKAARMSLALPDVKCFVGYDTSALEAFRYLKSHSAKQLLVLDVSNPFPGGLKIIQIHAKASCHDKKVGTWYRMISDRCLEEYALADKLLVASSFARDCVLEAGTSEAKVAVVPYGVDLDLFKPDPPVEHSTFRFLIVGAVSWAKGVGFAIEAFARLKLRDAEMIVVGAIRDKEILRRYRSVSNVRFIGHVRAGLPEIYRSADVLIFPSIADGFGQVLLEGMASGLPVIASVNSAGRDLVSEGIDGFVVRPWNLDDLADRMKYLYEHPACARAMGKQARIKACNYSWRHYARGIVRVFTEWLS